MSSIEQDNYVPPCTSTSQATNGHKFSLDPTKCEICTERAHKYKCPRCSLRTCSLDCCRRHKTAMNCSGERDRTKFVNKNEFDETQLLQDYKFLEENNLLVDTFQRNNIQQVEQQQQQRQHSASSENLRKFLHKSFGINLQVMPAESTRHKFNKTRFNRQTGLVSWSLQFVFHVSNSTTNSREDDKMSFFRFDTKNSLFSGQDTIEQIVSSFLHKFRLDLANEPVNKPVCDAYDLSGGVNISDAQLKHIVNGLHVVYEEIDHACLKKRYVRFEKQRTLENCLRGRVVIEYPTLHLVKAENLSWFDVEEDEEEKMANNVEFFKVPNVPPMKLSQSTVTKTDKSQNLEDLEDGECDDDEDEELPDQPVVKKIRT